MKKSEKAVARTIGKAIARRRTIAGLTQEQVAERLGVGQEAVSRMERGVASLTVARLATLAEIYQCNIAQLVTESAEREDDQARALSAVLSRLPHADRALLIEWMNVFAARLRNEPLAVGASRVGELIDGHADGFAGAIVDGHADGHAGAIVDGHADGHADGRLDGHRDGRIDGQLDGMARKDGKGRRRADEAITVSRNPDEPAAARPRARKPDASAS
ncbi:helix-turn-helix domain-containing protein [Paraburkholderia acidisoli]|uniref:helix-turn-helix domain-containing protein n=1 Tax=Paraburkholderia acidisoli TaxID=2571748 RepID=UPI0018EED0C1|nr:helix-turn-helix transcriptional regulator [Paraburkholderia acidisoli]